MDFLERELSQGQTAKLSGYSSDNLRDFRRRNLLKGFGEQLPSGRWVFNMHEVLTIAIARVFVENGQSLSYALWMADVCLLDVLHKALNRTTSEYGKRSDYVIFWLSTVGNPMIRTQGWELQWLHTDDPADVAETKATMSTVASMDQVAGCLSDTLKNVMRYGLAKAGRDGISVESAD